MENTIEGKQRYFAAHWGQDVLINNNSVKGFKVNAVNLWGAQDDMNQNLLDCLELTPLHLITDEHAIEVGKILHNDSHGISILELEKAAQNTRVADFLRSQSYAIEFDGVPVETLIDWGYCKLKTK